MMTRALAALGLLLDPRFVDTPAVAVRQRRRQALARASLVWGLIAFILATAGLAGMVETVKPEWRDPEYGMRLRQLTKWKSDAPERPLVLFLGSSRTQMGISPAAMGFPDEPGSPLVYNFGYRAGHPFRAWFQLMRLLDAGIKPDFVVLQLASSEITSNDRSQSIREDWAARLSIQDFQRLKPYDSNLAPLLGSWAEARVKVWSESGRLIISDKRPNWNPNELRRNYYWERMDRFGFAPHHIERLNDSQRQEFAARTLKQHGPMFVGRPVGGLADRGIRDLVDRCRAEGIPVALYWAPESDSYRSWYSPAARETISEYYQTLISELGVTVFPAPERVPDTDFIDGFHLMEHGAQKYSRWLAETHLKPWLARHGR